MDFLEDTQCLKLIYSPRNGLYTLKNITKLEIFRKMDSIDQFECVQFMCVEEVDFLLHRLASRNREDGIGLGEELKSTYDIQAERTTSSFTIASIRSSVIR